MGKSVSPKVLFLDVPGVSMRGKLASQQRCPMCGVKGKYREIPGKGLVCQCGGFAATALHVYIKWDGKPWRIIYDYHGRPLTNYPHAQRAYGEINSQIELGTFDPRLWTNAKANRLLWENYLADYLAREQMRCPPATASKKRSQVKHFVWFNGRTIREIKTSHCQDFAALPCLQLALAPKTRADLLAELRHIFEQAVAREDIERAPKVPAVTVPEKPIDWLAPEEQAAALAKIPEEHRPIFQFMMYYGCRVNEATALMWDQVDRAKGVFHFARTISRRKQSATNKTKKARPLPIMDFFESYLDTIPPGLGETPVFRNPKARNPEGRYTQDFLLSTWYAASEAAEIPHVTLKNATRSSRGMQAMNLDGWGQEDVALLFGHTSTQHTRKYARPELNRLRQRLAGSSGVASLESYRDKSVK